MTLFLNEVYPETFRNTITNETYTFNTNFSVSDYKRLNDYCFGHSKEVLADRNLIQDLVNAGLLPRWFDSKTCLNVRDETEDARAFSRMLDEYPSYLRKMP